jgi:hypothetical protein
MCRHVARKRRNPSVMMDDLHTLILALEQDESLLQPARLRERVRAMDFLEDVLMDVSSEPALESSPRSRAQALHDRLAHAQHELSRHIRNAIVQGDGVQTLRAWACPSQRPQDAEGYDHLDALVSEVFSFDEPAAEIAELDPEMVFYQPTPARHIFDFIERAAIGPDDVLIDLGSGLGHVPMLVSIYTGAQAIGIEREPVYVEGADHSARALNLDRVTFIAQDAREADLSRGTVFYLYTPFNGTILRRVLDLLKREAARRPIRIGTLGPCTPMVAAEPWLEAVGSQDVDRITLFRPCQARASLGT